MCYLERYDVPMTYFHLFDHLRPFRNGRVTISHFRVPWGIHKSIEVHAKCDIMHSIIRIDSFDDPSMWIEYDIPR